MNVFLLLKEMHIMMMKMFTIKQKLSWHQKMLITNFMYKFWTMKLLIVDLLIVEVTITIELLHNGIKTILH
jgi:hypothetical protein